MTRFTLWLFYSEWIFSLHLSAKKDLLGMVMIGLECSEAAGPEQDLRRVKSAKTVD